MAGDIWAAFTDKPEAMAVMEWFTKGEHLKSWMAAGGAIAPQKDADPAWYGSDVISAFIGKTIQNASAVRFDASDLMPGAVGSGAEWKEFTSWISGKEDLTPRSRTSTRPGRPSSGRRRLATNRPITDPGSGTHVLDPGSRFP